MFNSSIARSSDVSIGISTDLSVNAAGDFAGYFFRIRRFSVDSEILPLIVIKPCMILLWNRQEICWSEHQISRVHRTEFEVIRPVVDFQEIDRPSFLQSILPILALRSDF